MSAYRWLLWLSYAGTALVFWWACLDRYLAPRFLFLSAVLLGGLALLRRDLLRHADWRLGGLDLLLLLWYGLNAASVGWAFSWSEGVFYAQKVLLLFAVYWLARQMLLRDEGATRKVLRQASVLLSLLLGGLLLGQLLLAFGREGLRNEALYDYASALSGNKSLASDFLFFLLIFNLLCFRDFPRKRVFYALAALLLGLILLLQTRTVYLAVALGAALYLPARAWLEPAFRPVFWKKVLPLGVGAILLLAGLLSWKGQGSSLAERLNPATYLESVSANERRFVWYKTDLLNADHPWWGVGNGSWKFWFPSKSIKGGYRLQEENIVFTRVHNDYLEVRAEMGIVGVALFVGLFAAAFLLAFRAMRGSGGAHQRHDALVLAVGLLGYCVIQYLDFPRERVELQVVLALLLAYIAVLGQRAAAGGGFGWALPPGGRPWFLGLMALGLAFNVCIGLGRVRGEIHNKRLLDAQNKGDFKRALAESVAARNRFYEYTDVALPLQWHEGIALYQLRQHAQSLQAFEVAYQMNPWSFQVMNNYASALMQNQRHREAIAVLEKSLAINPNYDEGKLNLCFAHMQLAEYPEAQGWLDRVDTIRNPQTDLARRKNALVKSKQAEFRQLLETKMKMR